jgi:hypothetical protein
MAAYLAKNTLPRPLHEVERELFALAMKTARAALAQYVQSVGTGDVGTILEHEDVRFRRHGTRPTTYRSIFGAVPIFRAYYYHPDKGGICPLDASLSLPERSFSYVLQRLVGTLSAHDAYDGAIRTLYDMLGIRLSKSSAEELVADAAESVQAFQEQLPPPADEGPVLLIQADGKGIPMVRPAQKELGPKMRRKKGEKKNKKRMATVFTLATLNPEPAIPPTSLNRKTYGFLTTKKEAFARIAAEVAKRGYDSKRVVFLSDGDPDLLALQRRHFSKAEVCVDWIHVVERLWEAAYVFHPEGSPEAHAWVQQRKEWLMSDRAGTIIRGLKQTLTKRADLKPAQRKTLASVVGYLSNIRKHLPYLRFWANGLPISTGSVEGGCRHLISDRMERTGMHWKEPGAQALLDLRSVHLNDEVANFEAFRIKREQQRLYDSHPNNEAAA